MTWHAIAMRFIAFVFSPTFLFMLLMLMLFLRSITSPEQSVTMSVTPPARTTNLQ